MRAKLDLPLLLSVLGLSLFGLVMVYSASVFERPGEPQYFFLRQLVAFGVGIVALWGASRFAPSFWQARASTLLLVGFGILVAVLVFAPAGGFNGSRSWIVLPGGFLLQGVEVAKLCLIGYLAAWLVNRQGKVGTFETFWPFVGICTALSVLMLLQPDFGSLAVLIVIFSGMFWVAGMTWQQFGVGLALLGVLLAFVLSTPYRRDRLTAFRNSTEQVQRDSGYQISNAAIAIGSGSWFGQGFGESAQKRYFLPEPSTDAIFAVLVEELGFVFGLLTLALLCFIVWRAYRIGAQAESQFSQLVAFGIGTWFAAHIVFTIGAMLQLVPLTGLPLPFLSQGGSSLIMNLAAVGVLLAISRERSGGKGVSGKVPTRTRRVGA